MSDYKLVVPSGSTQNLITNPSFETGMTGWTNALGAIVQSSTYSRFGTYSAYQDDYELAYTTIAPTGVTVTASAYVKVVQNSAAQTLSLSIRTVAGVSIGTYNVTTAEQDGNWHRITVTSTTGTPARVYFGASGADVGGTVKVYWDAVNATETPVNLITNPSFETDMTGWTASFGAIARDGGDANCGAFSALQDDYEQSYTTIAPTGSVVYVSAYIKMVQNTNDQALNLSIRTAGGTVIESYTVTAADQDGNWNLISVTSTTGAPARVYIGASGADAAGVVEVYWDCISATEMASTVEYTHIDGDQPGCEWNGAAHASTSTLSGASRAGGIVYDLEDDYNVIIEAVLGTGTAARVTSRDGYAGQPGGALNNSVRAPRTFTYVGMFKSTTHAGLLDDRKALWDVINPEAYPKTADGWQPATLQYTGGTTTKQINAHYETGLEGDQSARQPFNERVALRFLAPDPNWYEVGDSAVVLDTNDTATLRYVAGRLKSTGQWDDLGLTANPTAGGVVYAICVARNRDVYIGGDFTGMNGVANRDYVAKYTPSTDTWSTVGGAAAINDTVFTIIEGPTGLLYFGGQFTAAGADADADYFAVYDPSADTFAAVGIPDAGAAAITEVRAIAIDSAGSIYVGGNFTNWADVAAADYFAKWTGAAWAAVGAGGTDPVYAIAIDVDDNIFIGGWFLNWAADANADNWAWWNGTAWAAVDDIALNDKVWSMAFDEVGNLYVGGEFTDADSIAEADYIFKWTGTSIEALDTGTNDVVRRLSIANDGLLWVGGSFTTAGSLTAIDRVAVWNGSVWLQIDLNLSGAALVYGMAFGNNSPVVSENYDTYIGFTTTGAGYFSGDTTVTNSGSAAAYPQIVFSRSGGTSARIISVRNWQTGAELSFDYSLLAGETLTVNAHPDAQTVVSSFFGSRPYALLAGSDFGDFMLLPGDNQITAFVDVAGAPTVVGYLLWKDGYDGVDD